MLETLPFFPAPPTIAVLSLPRLSSSLAVSHRRSKLEVRELSLELKLKLAWTSPPSGATNDGSGDGDPAKSGAMNEDVASEAGRVFRFASWRLRRKRQTSIDAMLRDRK